MSSLPANVGELAERQPASGYLLASDILSPDRAGSVVWRMEQITMTLPGYDAWKTHNPDDDRSAACTSDECSGECGRAWRDPDYERDKTKDER